MSNSYRPDIDGLRAVAVLAVIFFHLHVAGFSGGYVGVDVFFVVSGFVVTPLILRIFVEQSIGERLSNLKYFYARRFYRLAPALAVTLIFSVFAVLLFVSPAYHPRFANQGVFTLLLIGNIGAHRFSGDYFTNDPNPFVHTWSLSVEEQIYIFLPFALMLVFF
jgi:peptidoglycan/LPS O-acetylase OafA/YrhL